MIFGTGDIARLADFYFRTDSDYEVVGFTVDREYANSTTFLGKPLIAFEDIQSHFPANSHSMFVALSYSQMNELRKRKYLEAKKMGYRLATYISSRCTYLAEDSCGDNCFILEDNTIQPFVRIGSNVTLWSGNHIGHDSVIGSHCFISSHVVVSGHVQIGESCFLGVNATLRNSITIGNRTLIGAGALVMASTSEEELIVAERTRAHSSKKSSDVRL